MDHFATRSAAERSAYFTETAARMGVAPLIIEKDFWVSWCLKRVFQMNDIPGHIFKGGTSLSKAYKLINRFSEDIDISIDRGGLGFSGETDPAQAPSRKKREKLSDDLRSSCAKFIASEVLPRLAKAGTDLLGTAEWSVSLDERDADKQSILFKYPLSLKDYATGAYLSPSVLLECGCRGDQWPAEDKTIQCFVADFFPEQFQEPKVEVKVLAAERTFWEKVTLMHIENSRPKEKSVPPRLSRHYSDVARIFRSDIGKKAVSDTELLANVVKHKRVFFAYSWAHYDTAVPGSLQLVPNPQLERELRSDYGLMKEMFFGEVEPFNSILDTIRELESVLNHTSRPA